MELAAKSPKSPSTYGATLPLMVFHVLLLISLDGG